MQPLPTVTKSVKAEAGRPIEHCRQVSSPERNCHKNYRKIIARGLTMDQHIKGLLRLKPTLAFAFSIPIYKKSVYY